MSNFDPGEKWHQGTVDKPARLVNYLAWIYEIDNKTVYRHIRGESPGRFLGVNYLSGVITIEGIPGSRGPVASDFETILMPRQITEWNLNPVSGVVNSRILLRDRNKLEKYSIVEVRSVISGQVVEHMTYQYQGPPVEHMTYQYEGPPVEGDNNLAHISCTSAAIFSRSRFRVSTSRMACSTFARNLSGPDTMRARVSARCSQVQA